MRLKRETWLIGITALLFALVGIYFGTQRFQPTIPQPAATSLLFAQSLPDLQGQSQTLKQWQGKPLLVNFWATWCAPCVEEMPELSALQTSHANRELQIIGIGVDSANNIRDFAAKYKIAYPLYIAGMDGSKLSREMGNVAGGLPYTVLIGSDGQIKKTYLGRLHMESLHKDLAALR